VSVDAGNTTRRRLRLGGMVRWIRERFRIGKKARWTTREIVVAAVLAVAVGVIFWAWGLLWSMAIEAIPYLPVRYLFVGVWMIGGLLVPYVVRRPGAALLGELVAAFVSMALGNQWGGATMLSGLVEGLGAEIVFAALLWRNYSLPVMLGAGALAGIFSFILDSFFYGYWAQFSVNMILLAAVAATLSGAVLGGWVSKLLGDALARTGVLAGLEISRAQRRRS
jgi:energy-coupling factor transport system substrate-specific component